jgi:hypothetical protein
MGLCGLQAQAPVTPTRAIESQCRFARTRPRGPAQRVGFARRAKTAVEYGPLHWSLYAMAGAQRTFTNDANGSDG